MITIALSKGRLADQALDLLEKAGYDVSAGREKSRKLILEDPNTGLRFILAKPADVPTYVEYGAADLGVVGKDTLLEEGRQLYEVIDLLARGEPLPAKYRDHALIGGLSGWRDCHITPDWILLYAVIEDELVLALHRTGTHDDVGLE